MTKNNVLKTSTITVDANPLKLFGDHAAAKYLGVCVLTIHKLRKAGKIPYYQIGKRFFYVTTELDDFFRQPVGGRPK